MMKRLMRMIPESSICVQNTLEWLNPQFTKYQFKLNVKQLMCGIWNKLKTELINNLNQLKSHPQQKLNGKDLREERCKHKDNTRCVVEEEIEALGVKPLCRPPSGKQSIKECSWDTWTVEDPPSLIYPMHLSPPSSYSNEVTPNLFLL